MEMTSFDKNLKRLRTGRNLKQEDLANLLNVTRQTVSGWETGRRQPDLDMLTKLAQILNIDIQELICGTRPETYPRFQRTYVICAAVSGSIAAAVLLFRLLFLPHVKILCNSSHWGTLLTICTLLLPQAGAFASGFLFPSLIRLFMPVDLKKRTRLCCLGFCLTALIPMFLFWLGIPPCSRWFLSGFGNALLLYLLPAVTGAAISLGAFSEPTA